MANNASVEFRTGVADLDMHLNDVRPFSLFFNYVVGSYLERQASEQEQVAVMPTHITVAPFNDFEHDLAYDITSAVDLEHGRMISDEFKLKQKWLGRDPYQTLGIVDAEDRVIMDNVGRAYLGSLILLKGMYEAAHNPDFRGTS